MLAFATLACLFAACGASTVTVSSGPGTTATATTTPTASITVVAQTQSGTDATAANVSATAACPAGSPMVSGGYLVKPGTTTQLITISQDYPSAPNSWTATELNPQSGGSVSITAYAVCLTANFAVTITSASAVSATDGTAVAGCAPGTTLVGGGFQQEAAGANTIVSSFPAANAWQTKQTGQLHASYTAYALCASSALAAASLPMNTAAIANNTTGEADAACATGQVLVGGGFSFTGGGYGLTTDQHPSSSLTSWATKSLNIFIQPTSGPGGAPPTPTPEQLTSYGICVTPMG
jgi:hypothetical protein